MVSNVAGFGFIVKVLATPLVFSYSLNWLSSGSSIPAWLAGMAVVPRALRYQLALTDGWFTILVTVMPWLCRAVV